MTKMGAVLAQGIIDAGGRNMALCLRSRAGFVKTSAVVGMAVFLQHWYWHSYFHFISLSLAPTAVIGLNKDLQLPSSFSVTCLSKPSDFAYVRADCFCFRVGCVCLHRDIEVIVCVFPAACS